jgi:hypothetical protein
MGVLWPRPILASDTHSIKQQKTAPYGVRKPKIKRNAGKRKTTVNHEDIADGHTAIPFAIQAPATASLRSNKAIPALPTGNMVNSLCTHSA